MTKYDNFFFNLAHAWGSSHERRSVCLMLWLIKQTQQYLATWRKSATTRLDHQFPLSPPSYPTSLAKTAITALRRFVSSRGPPLELMRLVEEQRRTFHAWWGRGRFASWTVRADGADGKLVEHRRAQRVRGAATHDHPSRGYLREIRVRDAEATWSELFGDHLARALQDTVDVLLKRFHSDLHALLDLLQ